MQAKNLWRSATAWLVSLAVLTAVFVGVLPSALATVDRQSPQRFTARFADLREYLTEKGVTQNDYLTAYTPVADTTSVDGYLNTWMRERFASLSNSSPSNTAVSAVRSWFSQGNYLLTGADNQNGNSRLAVAGGSLHYMLVDAQYTATAPVMMRHTDTLIPQYNGRNVRLKNFEASLDFIMQDDGRRGGMVFNFHESEAGKIVSQGWNLNSHTGNTLVIGNGAGYSNSVVGGEGWVFHAYDPTNSGTQTFSSTTVDETIINSGETKAAGGVRFDSTYTAGTRYILTVRVLGGTATFTLKNRSSGQTVATLTKAYTTTDGYVSFGFSNRNVYMYNFEISELDDSGAVVDYGTYHDTYNKIESDSVFYAGFSDLSDAHWNGSVYKTDSTNTAYTATADTATVTLAGDTATYAFDANDKALAEYLNGKFDFYHSAPNGTLYKLANAYTSSNAVFTDAAGYVANWNVKDNKWLFATYGKRTDDLFRKTMTLVPKLEGTPIHVRDFEAEFDFSVKQDDSRSAVAFTFRSKEVGRLSNKSSYAGSEYTDSVTLVFNRLYLGIYDGTVPEYTVAGFHGSDKVTAWANKPAYGAVDTAHVYIRVVGNRMTLKVTSLDGTATYYENATAVSREEGGYLYLSSLSYESGFANVKITPIMAEDMEAPTGLIGTLGGITGFNAGLKYEYKLTTDDTWTAIPLGATKLTGLADGTYEVRFVQHGFYGASESVSVTVHNSVLDTDSADGVSRFAVDFSDLTATVDATAFDAAGYYTPTETDTAANAYMDGKFGLFYNNQAVFVSRMQMGQSSNPHLEADNWYDSYWRICENGTLVRYTGRVETNNSTGKSEVGNELMRKNEVLTVKAPNGNYAQLENFEATYQIHDEWQKLGAVTLAFRSDTAGKVVTKYGEMYANQQFVTIGTDSSGNAGISIAGETTKNGDERDAQYFAYNEAIPALKGVTDYKVTVKAVGTALTVQIAALDGTVLWENTETPATLTRSDAGYLSFALSNSTKAVKAIMITQLDDAGTPIDFGTGTRAPASHYDAENTVFYDFSDPSQLNDFDTWYLPAWAPRRQALISTTGNAETQSWEIKNGALYYKRSSLHRERSEIKEGVTVNGVQWQDDVNDAQSNLGVAVLKTKQYKNFIASFDFTGHGFWTQIGFGAKNTENGVYWTTMDGGYNFALEYDQQMGAVNFRYQIEAGDNVKRLPGCFSYDGTGIHHIDLIVSNGTAYFSLDGQDFITMALPADYDGGYIYLPLNRENVAIDNLKVTDLDAKEIEIAGLYDLPEATEIDRAAGEVLSFPQTGYGVDVNGYDYPLYLSFENGEYRSYMDGTFDFSIGVQLHNVKIADGYDAVFTVKNNINGDYDDTVSKKYYFDHPNDFLDFEAYYAQQSTEEGFWSTEGDPNPDDYWSTYDGELVKADAVTDKWQVTADGAVTNVSYSKTKSSGHVARLHNVSTLMLKDVNLKNFRLEADVKWTAEPNAWYSYLVFGVQDPTAMYAKLNKVAGALSTGHNTYIAEDENTAKGGVWAWVEQEGYFNLIGNLDGAQQSVRITEEGEGYDFMENFTADVKNKGEWFHMVIEVYDGVMSMRVDDSMTFYFTVSEDVYGGLVGIANHSQYSYFDNFQITALDLNGEETPFEDAQYGWADDGDLGILEYFGWDTSKKKWLFDWARKHIS